MSDQSHILNALEEYRIQRENDENGYIEKRYDPVTEAISDQANDANGLPVHEEKSEEDDEEGPIGAARKRKAYSKEFKLEAVQHAREVSKHAAATKFGVSRGTIQQWVKQEKDLNELPSIQAKRLKGGGRHLTSIELENELLKWIREERTSKHKVSRRSIRKMALKLASASTIDELNNNFVASEGFLQKFMKRNRYSTRVPTSIAQKPPKEFEQVLVNFVLYVSKIRQENNYELIYAADETGIWLDPIGGNCVEKKGAKEVTVLTTGHEKTRITVMLSGRSDGFKCRPFVLLNRKRPDPSIEKRFKNELNLVWSGKTWFDDELTSLYLDRTFGSMSFKKRLLVWDSFRCHISEQTKKKLKAIKLDSAIVPGGTTKFVQPADVSWNHPFKAKIRLYYEEWMMMGDHEKTKAGNLKAPPMEVYLQWIVDAWKALPKNLIEKSFKTCGITNDMNGLEDDQIHCFAKDSPIPSGLSKLSAARTDQFCAQIMEQIDLNEDENNEFVDSDASIVEESFEK